MRFAKKFVVCRWEDEVPIRILTESTKLWRPVKDCLNYKKGQCIIDNKKCKIITYCRLD